MIPTKKPLMQTTALTSGKAKCDSPAIHEAAQAHLDALGTFIDHATEDQGSTDGGTRRAAHLFLTALDELGRRARNALASPGRIGGPVQPAIREDPAVKRREQQLKGGRLA